MDLHSFVMISSTVDSSLILRSKTDLNDTCNFRLYCKQPSCVCSPQLESRRATSAEFGDIPHQLLLLPELLHLDEYVCGSLWVRFSLIKEIMAERAWSKVPDLLPYIIFLLFPVILEVMSDISKIDLATSREDDGCRGGYLNLVTWIISWQLGGRGSWRGKAGGGGCREAEKQWRNLMWWVVWEDCRNRSTSSTLSILFRRMEGLFFNCQHTYLGQLEYIDIA